MEVAVVVTAHDQREQVAALVEEMYTGLDDDVHISHSRWAVFSYLSERSGNAQHRVLLQDSRMALFRNLRGWIVPEPDRERMVQVCRDFRDSVLRGDRDEAERLARAMHYV